MLLAEIAPGAVIADKAYDFNGLIEPLVAAGVIPVIPPKRNRTTKRACDFTLYKERNLIERFFNNSSSSELSRRAMTKPPAGLSHP